MMRKRLIYQLPCFYFLYFSWRPFRRDDWIKSTYDTPLGIVLLYFLHITCEVNRGHDTIAKLLIDNRFQWKPVDEKELVQSINRRVARRNLDARPANREEKLWEPLLELLPRNLKNLTQFLKVFFFRLGLAVEQGSGPDLRSSDLFCNFTKR